MRWEVRAAHATDATLYTLHAWVDCETSMCPMPDSANDVALRIIAAVQALRDGVQDVAVKVLASSQLSGIAEGIQLQILKKVWLPQPRPFQPNPTPYQPQCITPLPLSSPPAQLPEAQAQALASPPFAISISGSITIQIQE